MVTPNKNSHHHWISPRHRCGYCQNAFVGSHAMTQTMHKFFACRASMRPEDQRNRNPRNFDNGSNLNWRGIFLFVVYTSVFLGFFLFSRNGNYGSVDEPAPRLSCDERNRGQAPIPSSERSLQTIVARPWLRVSNEGLELEGPAFDGEGHLLFLETYGGSSISPKINLINIQSAPDLRAALLAPAVIELDSPAISVTDPLRYLKVAASLASDLMSASGERLRAARRY
jgi:hypothetical protein